MSRSETPIDARAVLLVEIELLTDEEVTEAARVVGVINHHATNRRYDGPEEPPTGCEETLSFLKRVLQIQIDAPADFSEQVLRARHGDFYGD